MFFTIGICKNYVILIIGFDILDQEVIYLL